MNTNVNNSSPTFDDYIAGATRYLRSEGVLVDEPYELPNLHALEKLTVTPTNVSFDAYYKISSQKIFCHLCGGHRHNLGLVGLTEEGVRILFGSECAKNYFGADVWKKIDRDQQEKIAEKNEQYRGIWIAQNVGRTVQWLTDYSHIIASLRVGWANLFQNHPTAVDELLDHLSKNRGRLTEIRSEKANASAKAAGLSGRHFGVTSIVISLPAWEGIRTMGQIDSDIAALRFLCGSVLETENPTVEDFSRWDRYLTSKVRAGADNIDNFVRFSVALFSNGALETCADWLDRRRIERLTDRAYIAPRHLAPLWRKQVGGGYELPRSLLKSTLPDFTLGNTVRVRA